MEETPVVSGGRGRGRGGGIAVLPAGMWDSLNSNDKKSEIEIPKSFDTDAERFEEADNRHDSGNGRNNRDAYHDSKETGGDRGKGLEKDLKGRDWDCPSCSNTNWSWRTNCNMCGAPKPAALVSENELRDGAGGGFNERQDRASAATVEIDDEGFDDFGRRVKNNTKRADRQAKEEAALKRLNEKYKHLIPSELETMLQQPPTSTTTTSSATTGMSSSINADSGDRRSSDSRQQYSSGRNGDGRGSSGRERSRSRDRDYRGSSGSGRSDDHYGRKDDHRYSSNSSGGGGYGRSSSNNGGRDEGRGSAGRREDYADRDNRYSRESRGRDYR